MLNEIYDSAIFSVINYFWPKTCAPLVYQRLPTFPLMGDMSVRDELKEGPEGTRVEHGFC